MKPVAIVNRIITIGFDGFSRDISIIKSLEKNPAMNGSPQSAMLADKRAAMVMGICCVRFPTVRRSCE